ncbi:MAG: hypothetical protein KDI51_11175 [Xanthomonadales bacterium]|nr:hypothetical protein [Xanthomonadales bacterium]
MRRLPHPLFQLTLGLCLIAPAGAVFAAQEAELRALALGQRESLRVQPGVAAARSVAFEAVELRAPGARTWVVSGGHQTPLAADSARFYLGEDADGARWGLLYRDGVWTAASHSSGTLVEFDVHWEGDLARLTARLEAPSEPLHSECGSDAQMALESGMELPVRLPPLANLLPLAPAGVTGTATLAVDTDNEWLFRRFANNTTQASAWVDQMIMEMNVVYERDLSLRVLRGTTFLRVDPDVPPTFNDDPFNNTDSPASSAQLNEFGNYWQNNQSAVPRAFALLLSGKSSSGFSASGIAWLDRYCDNNVSGGASYSINQAFWNSGVSIGSSLRIIAHELGHNLGSAHTHCYSPPVDQCYRAESGCYSGSVSCPGAGPGTLMSYCNFGAPNGANCGSNQLVFHPTVITRIGQSIAANTPACIVPLGGGGNEIFANGFE